MAETNLTTINDSRESAPLLPWISDQHLSLLVFPVFFWLFSFIFGAIEWAGVFQQYRLRTPAEEVTLNKVNRKDCLINVLLNQAIQVSTGLIIQTLYSVHSQSEVFINSNDSTTIWSARAYWLVSHFLYGLGVAGIDTIRLAEKYSSSTQVLDEAFMVLIHSFLIPAFQLLVAIIVADMWQYFSHRWCHANKYVYSTWLKSLLWSSQLIKCFLSRIYSFNASPNLCTILLRRPICPPSRVTAHGHYQQSTFDLC